MWDYATHSYAWERSEPQGWLDEDPPTWDWSHDPDYYSLRQRAIAAAYVASWEAFTGKPYREAPMPCGVLL